MTEIAETAARPASLTDQTLATARDVLAGRRVGWRASLAFVGPAVIASIAYMDPGNFATNIQAGAKYGYGLLWVVLLANLIAMLFQGLSAKLGIVTGRNLAELCRDHFPRPVVIAIPRLLFGPVAGFEPAISQLSFSSFVPTCSPLKNQSR